MLIFRGVVPEISQLFLYKSLFAPAASLGASTTAETMSPSFLIRRCFKKTHDTVSSWALEDRERQHKVKSIQTRLVGFFNPSQKY